MISVAEACGACDLKRELSGVPFSLLLKDGDGTMDKPFKTYEELLTKLRDEKKLEIPDEAHVIELLKKHSYFSLVSGYKSLFKLPNGEYRPGTTIDDLLALFEFDEALRDIFFHNIQIVEKHIKSLLAYSFVEKYGDDQQAYLNPNNYSFIGSTSEDTYSRCAEVKRLVQVLSDKVHVPFDQKYIAHQWQKHKNVPLWATIKAVTMGTASKMYSLCTQDIQAEVSREFPLVTERQLVGMLDLLTKVRNVCAHNERLYDFNAGKKRAIQAMPLHTQLQISKKKSYYKKGQCDLFAAMVCFKYLLSPEEFRSTVGKIDEEVKALCKKTKQIPPTKILCCMGFPQNWKDSVNF